VGLAALSLLADAANEQPLLCVIDDAQWLDRASAQVMGFVARRLFAEQVALVVATREPGGEFRGLPELAVGGLGDGAARELLASVIRRPLDERVRERFIAETGGNPLALLALPQGLTPAELAGALALRPRRGCCGGWRTASGSGSGGWRRRRNGCCWSRRPSRPATRCWCGGRPGGWGSEWRRRPRQRPRGC